MGWRNKAPLLVLLPRRFGHGGFKVKVGPVPAGVVAFCVFNEFHTKWTCTRRMTTHVNFQLYAEN